MLMVLVGCAPEAPDAAQPPPLEAEEVGSAVDAVYEPDRDERAAARPPELMGWLPGDYPSDLPVYRGSSLFDFGDVGTGVRYVVLRTPHPAARVLTAVEQELRELGWHRGPDPELWEKEGRRARVSVDEGPPTALRIQYPPRS